MILSEQGIKGLTYIAKYFPGDLSLEYTSPWAGGNFSTVSADTPEALLYDKLTFSALNKIYKQFSPNEIGLEKLPATEYFGAKDLIPSKRKLDSLAEYIPDLKITTDPALLPKGVLMSLTFTTFNFFCPKFILFLKNHLESEYGAKFIRKDLSSLQEAFTFVPDANVLFNCSGMGARALVPDTKVYPTRGQVVVIRAPQIQENFALDLPQSTTYVIPRPYSGGEVICGGYMDKNVFVGDTFGSQTQSILERVTQLLGPNRLGKFEILREVAGLRPSREGGTRIELEKFGINKIIVHNYGAGGTGFQSGYGMASISIDLLNKHSNSSKL